jgi:thiamine biosynthesis lipoprotein
MQIYQQHKRALGSDCLITLKAPEDSIGIDNLFIKLWKYIDEFEKRFSRFVESSELSDFNKTAGQKFVTTREFKDLLIKSKEMSKLTNGIFNPFILPILQKVGYLGSWPNVAKGSRLLDFHQRELHDYNELKISNHWALIPKHSAIDFGGIGKGYLLDKIIAEIPSDIDNYWISLGGDIIFRGVDVNHNNWPIFIADAKDTSKNIASVDINDQNRSMAIATSGTIKRKGDHWNHLINPTTQFSVKTDIIAASVLAVSGTLADVMAKYIVIKGSGVIDRLISDKIIIGALVQTASSVKIYGDNINAINE